MKSKHAFLCLFTSLFLFTSCEKVYIDDAQDPNEEISQTGKRYKVNVLTRAATVSSDVSFPISVTATDSKGNIVAEQAINNAEEGVSLSLPNGSYTITAVSGPTDFNAGYTTKPLLIGNANITVNSATTRVNIIMAYVVASTEITMGNVPDEVTSMTVTLSQMYKTVSPSGDYSGSTSVQIPCTKTDDNIWTTGTKYVLPSVGNNTVISISMTSPSGTNVYAVTYPSPLKAAVPYRFTGTYSGTSDGDFSVTGSLEYEGWGTPISDTFIFGPSTENGFNNDQPAEESENITVTQIPAPGTLVNGHVVAYVDGTTGLLLSLAEYSGMTSDQAIAADIASKYVEGGMSGWNIPTTAQANLLTSIWNSSTCPTINAVLVDNGGQRISLHETNGNNSRYLCNDAKHTFTFTKDQNILQSGSSVKTYRLRLVKQVHFIVN